VKINQWYELKSHVSDEFDMRDVSVIGEEYLQLLTESIRLRFRSDVPVGFNISGGLDSSILLSLVNQETDKSDIRAFTFATGDERYDEVPYVKMMLKDGRHPHDICMLRPEEIPELAASVQYYEDEPFGGFQCSLMQTSLSRQKVRE